MSAGEAGIAAPEAGFRAPEAAQQAGLSYRQIDYYARTELLKPSLRTASGTGSQRLYSAGDIRALRVIGRLMAAGWSVRHVRSMIDGFRSCDGVVQMPPEWTAEVAPGITVTVTGEAVTGP